MKVVHSLSYDTWSLTGLITKQQQKSNYFYLIKTSKLLVCMSCRLDDKYFPSNNFLIKCSDKLSQTSFS